MVFKYKFVDPYGFCMASLHSPVKKTDAYGRFYALVSECFDISKHFYDPVMFAVELKGLPAPAKEIGGYEMLGFLGEDVVWDKEGNKVKRKNQTWFEVLERESWEKYTRNGCLKDGRVNGVM